MKYVAKEFLDMPPELTPDKLLEGDYMDHNKSAFNEFSYLGNMDTTNVCSHYS